MWEFNSCPEILIFLELTSAIIISIPCSGYFAYIIYWAYNTLTFRPSNHLLLHSLCWMTFMLSSIPYAFYLLVKAYFGTLDLEYNLSFLKWSLAINLGAFLLIPISMILVTVDRCVSLWKPKWYNVLNSNKERQISRIVFAFLLVVYTLAIVEYSAVENNHSVCFLLSCVGSSKLVFTIAIYKLVSSLLNILLCSNFCFMFVLYNRQRSKAIRDKTRNRIVIVLLCSELVFNVAPSIAYFFLPTHYRPLVFGCVNVDAAITTFAYLRAFRRLKKTALANKQLGNVVAISPGSFRSASSPTMSPIQRTANWQAWK